MLDGQKATQSIAQPCVHTLQNWMSDVVWNLPHAPYSKLDVLWNLLQGLVGPTSGRGHFVPLQSFP